MLSVFCGVYKILLFLSSVVFYLLSASVGEFLIRDETRRRHYLTENVQIFAKWGMLFMNVKVVPKNLPSSDQNYLFVGNHLGMLDVIALASIKPALFITSVEMQQTPGLGLLCEMGGCLFVERRNRGNIQNEILKIREALNQGLSVVLYPEGTSTNGEGVLPFKKSLMTAAAGTGVPIRPMVINYTHVNGQPMSDLWRDTVCWYGDITFVTGLWRMFSAWQIVAEITFLDEIVIHNEEERREVAAIAHDRILKAYKPILKPV